MDVLVMENLLFRRRVTRVYDLKGSTRSRYNADTSGTNTVLLDQNLIEAMSTSPIFVGNKAKRVLERAVWNDTSFLAVSLNLIQLMLLSCKFRTSTITNFFSKVDDNFKHTSQSQMITNLQLFENEKKRVNQQIIPDLFELKFPKTQGSLILVQQFLLSFKCLAVN